MTNNNLIEREPVSKTISIADGRTGILSLMGLSNIEIGEIEGIGRQAVTARLLKVPPEFYKVPQSILAGALAIMNASERAAKVLIYLMENESTSDGVRASVAMGIYDKGVGFVQQQQANKDKSDATDKGDDAVFNQSEINQMARQHLLSIGEELEKRKAKDKANKVEAKAEVVQSTMNEDETEQDEMSDDEGGGTPE